MVYLSEKKKRTEGLTYEASEGCDLALERLQKPRREELSGSG